MMSFCSNLDFGRTLVDLVACGCSSSVSFEKSWVRYHRKPSCKSFNRVYEAWNCVSRRDRNRCRVYSMKTTEALFNGIFIKSTTLYWLWLRMNILQTPKFKSKLWFAFGILWWSLQMLVKALHQCWTWRSQDGLFHWQIRLKWLPKIFKLWTEIFSRWVTFSW